VRIRRQTLRKGYEYDCSPIRSVAVVLMKATVDTCSQRTYRPSLHRSIKHKFSTLLSCGTDSSHYNPFPPYAASPSNA